jgi:2-isopropylmalate synthase
MLEPLRQKYHPFASIDLSDEIPFKELRLVQLASCGVDLLSMPLRLQDEFSLQLQAECSATRGYLASTQIWRVFEAEYLAVGSYVFIGHQLSTANDRGIHRLRVRLTYEGQGALVDGEGANAVNAMIDALGLGLAVLSHEQHSFDWRQGAQHVAFVETSTGQATAFGIGVHPNSVAASLIALLSAANRALHKGLLDNTMRPATSSPVRR